MTRPFCVIGFTALFTLFVMHAFPQKEAMGAAFTAALIAFMLSLTQKAARRDKTLPTAFLTAVICIAMLWTAQTQYAARQDAVLEKKEVLVSGTLADLPYTENGRYYAVLRVHTLNGEPSRGKIRLVSRTPFDISPADGITCRVKPFLLGGEAENEAVSAYYRAKGIVCGAYPVDGITVISGGNTGLFSAILSLRQALTQAVFTRLPNEAGGVIACISFGVKTLLSERSTNAFRASGISHLLVVSGLHLSTWTMYLFEAFKKIRVPRRARAVLGLLFVAFFAVLTGGAPSVLRAAVMSAAVFSAELFRRESDAFNAVGIALTAMLFCNPFAARDLSLLLSVFATVGILLFSKRIEAVLNRPVRKRQGRAVKLYKFTASVIATTVSVTVCTLPVQLWAFGTLSLTALPANLLSLTVGSICMVLGMLGAVFSVLHLTAVGNLFLLSASGCARYLLSVTQWLSSLPFSVLPMRTNYAKLLLALILIGIAVGIWMRKPHVRLRKIACVLAAVLFLFCNVAAFTRTETVLQMTVADVGDGMAVVLRCRGETVLLLSGGAYYADSEIYGILSSYGATDIDAMFLPAQKEKLIPSAISVGNALPVGTLYYARALYAETLPVGQEKLPIDKTAAVFADGRLRIAVQSAGAYSYAKITFGAFSALVSFTDTNDFKGDSATVLLTTAEVPKNIRAADFQMTVMSTSVPEKADFLCAQSDSVYTTAENGSLSFWIEPNGEFQYARRD